jgi:hypothetical protein
MVERVQPDLVDERGMLIEVRLAAFAKTTLAIAAALVVPLGIGNGIELVVTEGMCADPAWTIALGICIDSRRCGLRSIRLPTNTAVPSAQRHAPVTISNRRTYRTQCSIQLLRPARFRHLSPVELDLRQNTWPAERALCGGLPVCPPTILPAGYRVSIVGAPEMCRDQLWQGVAK